MQIFNQPIQLAVVPQTWLDTLLIKVQSMENLLQKKSEEEVSNQ